MLLIYSRKQKLTLATPSVHTVHATVPKHEVSVQRVSPGVC
jgi:hypothetical protein